MPDEGLHIPTVFDEAPGQPIQQFGMGGGLAIGPKLVGGADNGIRKKQPPEPVDRDSRSERVRRIYQPSGQIQSIGARNVLSRRQATRGNIGRDPLALRAVVTADPDVARAPFLHVFHDAERGNGTVQVVATLLLGRQAHRQLLHLRDASGAVIRPQLQGLGRGSLVHRPAGNLTQGGHLRIACFTVGGEVKSAPTGPIHDLEQEMILSGFQHRLNLFLIGGSTATHILGQQLAAVEPNADSVIASQEERLGAHLARGQNTVQISGSKVVGQGLHHAILPTGFEDPRFPIVAKHRVGLKPLLRPKLPLKGHLAVGFHEGAHASPGP